MSRPVLLFSNGWIDTPLEDLAINARDWGYAGFELACLGDHLEVQRALSEKDYCSGKLESLAAHDLQIPVISNHRVGQAICDPVDERHQALLPDYVWGDGKPEGVRQRAIEEMMATFRVAEKLGTPLVSGFTGSSLWSYLVGYPAPKPEKIRQGFREFAQLWNPILDVARECGVKFAFEVHPGQIAFDYYSTEMVLDAIQGREEFGLTFDPAHLHWQGIDPVEYIRRFGDRIYHVHMRDAVLTFNGRSGVLNSYFPSGDPRRGWQFRTVGHGGIDWESLIRELNAIGYQGAFSVDFHDPGMDRDYAAREACEFIKRLDFPPAIPTASKAFR